MDFFFNFKPTTIYYMRFNSGEEIISEVYMQGDENGMEYFLINPMVIHAIDNGEEMKLATMQLMNADLVEEQNFSFNPNQLVFATDKLTEMLLKIYDSFNEFMENPDAVLPEPIEDNRIEIQSEIESNAATTKTRTLH